MRKYNHTQKAPVAYLVLPIVAVIFACATLAQGPLQGLFGLCLACLLLILFFSFRYLNVRQEKDHLAIRFGPIPLFKRSIPYAQMTGVEKCRSDFIDGGGIHYIPGRGWIYNLWGGDCVKIHLGEHYVRVGSDAIDGLYEHLREQISK